MEFSAFETFDRVNNPKGAWKGKEEEMRNGEARMAGFSTWK